MQFSLLDAVEDAGRCWVPLDTKYALEGNLNFLLMSFFSEYSGFAHNDLASMFCSTVLL
jgi:hypothetical protein